MTAYYELLTVFFNQQSLLCLTGFSHLSFLLKFLSVPEIFKKLVSVSFVFNYYSNNYLEIRLPL
jgi:hypothetical protein